MFFQYRLTAELEEKLAKEEEAAGDGDGDGDGDEGVNNQVRKFLAQKLTKSFAAVLLNP